MDQRLRFTKMHGIGNDYIYVDCLDQEISYPVRELTQRISDRHFGVGGDGVVLILPSEKADYRMQMFNADGSEGAMCGNAVRCIGKYLFEKHKTNERQIALETYSGIRTIELSLEGSSESDSKVSQDPESTRVASVRVDMGEPILDPGLIPVALNYDQVVQVPVKFAGEDFLMTTVSMGNPHAVFFVDEITDYHIQMLGPTIEEHALFPDRVNVEFVQVIDRSRVKMRVWERGSGETLACGTGACAVTVAGSLAGLLDRTVDVELLGGELRIEWADNNHVYKTGPANFAFEGEVDLSELMK